MCVRARCACACVYAFSTHNSTAFLLNVPNWVVTPAHSRSFESQKLEKCTKGTYRRRRRRVYCESERARDCEFKLRLDDW